MRDRNDTAGVCESSLDSLQCGPMNADYACEKISGPAGRNYKTAKGEMVEGQGFVFDVRVFGDTNCT